jgi:lipopolysaccharide/colanic/teichoic acid biosynthesis glycosyltransferase
MGGIAMTNHQNRTVAIEAITDSIVALFLVVGAVCIANKNQLPQGGWADFLSIRITVLNASFAIVFSVAWKQCLESFGLYRRDFKNAMSIALRALTGCVIMTALLAFYLECRQASEPVIPVLLGFLTMAFSFELCRGLVMNRPIWGSSAAERVLILGSGRRASTSWREFRIQHHHSKEVLGFVDDRPPFGLPPDIAARFVCTVEELPDYLLRNAVDELVVAKPLRSQIFNMVHGKNIQKRASLFIELVPRDSSRETAESAKRVFDFLLAAAGLILLAPLFALIGLLIKLTSPGPVFFVQRRYGYGRRCFDMYKFRSMVQDAPGLQAALESRNEASGPIFKIKNDPRITLLGGFLRRTSLDELPQLWNVFLGDMSLVGPRPMSVRDVSLFSEAQLMRRFSVRPGITGTWQVSGRSSLSFDQWMDLDFSYIDDWSLILDLKILARTLPAVLRRAGAM